MSGNSSTELQGTWLSAFSQATWRKGLAECLFLTPHLLFPRKDHSTTHPFSLCAPHHPLKKIVRTETKCFLSLHFPIEKKLNQTAPQGQVTSLDHFVTTSKQKVESSHFNVECKTERLHPLLKASPKSLRLLGPFPPQSPFAVVNWSQPHVAVERKTLIY